MKSLNWSSGFQQKFAYKKNFLNPLTAWKREILHFLCTAENHKSGTKPFFKDFESECKASSTLTSNVYNLSKFDSFSDWFHPFLKTRYIPAVCLLWFGLSGPVKVLREISCFATATNVLRHSKTNNSNRVCSSIYFDREWYSAIFH